MLPEMLNIHLATALALAVSHVDISREDKKNKREVRAGHRIHFCFVCCIHHHYVQAKLIELRLV